VGRIKYDINRDGLSVSAKDAKIADECIIYQDVILGDDEMSRKFDEVSRRMYEETVKYDQQNKT